MLSAPAGRTARTFEKRAPIYSNRHQRLALSPLNRMGPFENMFAGIPLTLAKHEGERLLACHYAAWGLETPLYLLANARTVYRGHSNFVIPARLRPESSSLVISGEPLDPGSETCRGDEREFATRAFAIKSWF